MWKPEEYNIYIDLILTIFSLQWRNTLGSVIKLYKDHSPYGINISTVSPWGAWPLSWAMPSNPDAKFVQVHTQCHKQVAVSRCPVSLHPWRTLVLIFYFVLLTSKELACASYKMLGLETKGVHHSQTGAWQQISLGSTSHKSHRKGAHYTQVKAIHTEGLHLSWGTLGLRTLLLLQQAINYAAICTGGMRSPAP
jgi:hypothetical protein